MAATSKTRRRTTASNLSKAVAAYEAGESIQFIEDLFSTPNQTLYRELDRRGIKRRRAPRTQPLCWWCGSRVKDSHVKTCGKEECRKESGVAIRWKEDEVAKLLSMKVNGLSFDVMSHNLPGRTAHAIETKLSRSRALLSKVSQ